MIHPDHIDALNKALRDLNNMHFLSPHQKSKLIKRIAMDMNPRPSPNDINQYLIDNGLPTV